MINFNKLNITNRPTAATLKRKKSGPGTVENHRKEKRAKRIKKNRGDFHRPLSGYVYNPFTGKNVFVENMLETQNRWLYWYTMPYEAGIWDIPEDESEKISKLDNWWNELIKNALK